MMTAMSTPLVIGAVALAACGAGAETPGARFGLTTAGLNAALGFWAPHELPALQHVVIPGESASHYTFEDIHLQDVNLGPSTISSNDAGVLEVHLTDIAISVPTTKFRIFQKVLGVKIGCAGTITAAISGTTITLDTTATNKNGKPDVKITGEAKVGDIELKHKLSAATCKITESVISAFIGNIDKKIKKAIVDKLTPAISEIVGPAIADAIEQLAFKQEVYPGIVLDYSLVGPITINSRGLALGVKGEFRKSVNPSPRKFVPVAIPEPALLRQAELSMSEAMLNQASDVLAVPLAHGDVKAGTTADIKAALGPLGAVLYNMCPDCPIGAHFAINQAPMVSITAKTGVEILVHDASLNVSMVDPKGNVISIGATRVNVTASAIVGLTPDGKFATAQYAMEKFAIYHTTAFGGAATNLIETLISKAIRLGVVPYANVNFGKLPIPAVPNTTFKHAAVIMQDGWMGIHGDIDFKN